jgi:hypothetical protein
MKVNNPNAGQGKMIIRYKGKNELLKNHPDEMKWIYMHRNKEVQPDADENLVIETDLFDDTNVCFSLSSANLYCGLLVDNKKTWVTTEEDCAVFYQVNIDNEQVIFEGSIGFKKEITSEFFSHESYQILLFFKNSKDFMELLDKNNIDYIYHS